jgi:hypothetical protein
LLAVCDRIPAIPPLVEQATDGIHDEQKKGRFLAGGSASEGLHLVPRVQEAVHLHMKVEDIPQIWHACSSVFPIKNEERAISHAGIPGCKITVPHTACEGLTSEIPSGPVKRSFG